MTRKHRILYHCTNFVPIATRFMQAYEEKEPCGLPWGSFVIGKDAVVPVGASGGGGYRECLRGNPCCEKGVKNVSLR